MKEDSDIVSEFKSFGRFCTAFLEMLNEPVLLRPYSLAGARVLRAIDNTANQIARELKVDRGYLSRILRELEVRGLLREEKSTSDRRVRLLSLTEKGKEVLYRLEDKSTGKSVSSFNP